MFKNVLLIPLVFLFSLGATAQEQKIDELPSRWELLKYDGISALGGVKKTYTQPLNWDKENYLIAGGIIAGTGAIFLFDEQSSDWFINQEDDIPRVLKDFGWYFGNPQNNYAINGAVYLYGLFTRNEEIRKTGVLLISAASAAGIIQTFSKTITGRARPGTGEGKSRFKPFSNEGKYHSFPSGHTILSFTTAYAIGKQFSNPYIKGGIYALGMVAPASRLWGGAHWFSDIALSTAISIVVVEVIDKYLNEERNYGIKKEEGVSWNLQLGPAGIGVVGRF